MKFIKTQIGNSRVIAIAEWLERGIFHGFLDGSFDFKHALNSWQCLFEKGEEATKLNLLQQVHSAEFILINSNNHKLETILASDTDDLAVSDGWIIDLSERATTELTLNQSFGVRTADCVPVILASKDGEILSVLHCGWRGTVDGLLINALNCLKELTSADIEVAIGPGADKCCYVVGDEVVSGVENSLIQFGINPAVKSKVLVNISDNQQCFNIKELLRSQALSLGVRPENIAISPICTICNEQFFSFRRQKDHSGRQVSFIGGHF